MNRSNTTSFTIRLLVFVFSIAFFGADSIVLAQNANSNTTTPPEENMSMQNDNASNMNTTRGGRRRRRGRRSTINANAGMTDANTSGAMQENANMAGEGQDNTNMTANTSMGGRRRRRGRRRGGNMNMGEAATTESAMTTPVRTGRCDPNVQEQTDLSGTYTGTVDFSEGGLSGDTTLTITGNDFTMTGGSTTQEGRVVAVTTCNYTAVTMRFGKDTPVAPGATPPPPLPTVSLRARRMGNGLSLMSVPGEARRFSFRSAGSGGGGMRRGRRGRRRASRPAATTENACGPMAHPVSVQ